MQCNGLNARSWIKYSGQVTFFIEYGFVFKKMQSLEIPSFLQLNCYLINLDSLSDKVVSRSPANTDIEDILNKKQQLSVNGTNFSTLVFLIPCQRDRPGTSSRICLHSK